MPFLSKFDTREAFKTWGGGLLKGEFQSYIGH